MLFDDLSVSEDTKRAVRELLKLQRMTEVQEMALPQLLDGADAVIKAKTGTGKTLAFLIPIVETMRGQPSKPGGPVRAIVLSPARELAMQTADVAAQLLEYQHGPGVFCMGGHRNVWYEREALQSDKCDVIVTTPGRLLDHLTQTVNFHSRCEELQYLVLDEADRLLNGFQQEVLKILELLPGPEVRQGVLCSATFPSDVNDLAWFTLKRGFKYISTVALDEEETPTQVTQLYTVVTLENIASVLWGILRKQLAADPEHAKIMVFFTTARVTQYYAELFRWNGMRVLEMHSRRAQQKRIASASDFWTADRGVFFSTDVSARGLDYPDVSTVVHFGAPSSRDRYVHRLGRTGRAGQSGESILLLHDFETRFLEDLEEFSLRQVDTTELVAPEEEVPPRLGEPLEDLLVGQAYKAWLGYYKFFSDQLGWTREHLVKQSARFAASIGALDAEGRPPGLKKKQAIKMGLLGVQGLNVLKGLPYLDIDEDEESGGEEDGGAFSRPSRPARGGFARDRGPSVDAAWRPEGPPGRGRGKGRGRGQGDGSMGRRPLHEVAPVRWPPPRGRGGRGGRG